MLLVDRRGRILLQQRDEHPALDPLKWGLVGGHLDPGEDFAPGAYRELEEETGVSLAPGSLTFFAEYAVHGGRMQVFAAGVDLTDDDVECHEGLQIVFVDAAEVPRLDLGTAASVAVVDFLDSSLYADLAG
ncbi:MAG TPA: NUDIX domain-containing protein [Nocardioides sp.]|nr:NUDIX domain-containing protein [Nocardioides sp.]